MIAIEQITPLNLHLFKAIRLEALQESPHAFGSTYAREVQFTDADWRARLDRWNGENGIGFLAMDNQTPCGLAGALRDELAPKTAQLVSMWTAPAYRCQAVGRLLVKAVLRWANLRSIETLQLMVTSANQPAILFYERLGFSMTGRTGPYPNNPDLFEYEMSRCV